MRIPISFIGFGVLAWVVFHFGRLLNGNVVAGAWLSGLGVLLGAAFTLILYMLSRQRNARSMYIMEENPSRTPWYKKVFQTEWILISSVIASMWLVSFINQSFAWGETYTERFEVAQIIEYRLRTHSYPLIEVENDEYRLRVIHEHAFDLGQSVEVTMQRGALGFVHATRVEAP
ncbi:hypothetical protein [Aliidiomarina maris]|uniref:Uncharacterized protein n=1 Tax=Aliidiomarina maris TaxID=531312 RepID=A0A327X6A9_9GAMM|nr:hypothetical protein [Aliidiomarina maris]MCL4410521.1 hypothetical protein [Gammaproteobacteria bacterium]MCL5049915.1 hypothetical protein [Bacillota bacterium]RAK01423.1 hypothetical protein B0I24_10146 [Aliidiomarina maris]RUO28265.1 hypothetical protein CWE07_00210 [Aliidiomarina maris]